MTIEPGSAGTTWTPPQQTDYRPPPRAPRRDGADAAASIPSRAEQPAGCDSTAMDRIRRFVACSTRAVTADEVAAFCACPKATAQALLSMLTKRGNIYRVRQGQYAGRPDTPALLPTPEPERTASADVALPPPAPPPPETSSPAAEALATLGTRTQARATLSEAARRIATLRQIAAVLHPTLAADLDAVANYLEATL